MLAAPIAFTPPARAACVWTGSGGERVGPFLTEWVSEHGGGALALWNVEIADDTARLELRTAAAGTVRITLTLGDDILTQNLVLRPLRKNRRFKATKP